MGKKQHEQPKGAQEHDGQKYKQTQTCPNKFTWKRDVIFADSSCRYKRISMAFRNSSERSADDHAPAAGTRGAPRYWLRCSTAPSALSTEPIARDQCCAQ